jgi:ABC-type sugar transport system substrate-binding protein
MTNEMVIKIMGRACGAKLYKTYRRKKIKRFVVVFAAAVLALSLAGCSGKKEQKGSIKIGYISPGSDTWYLRAEEGAKWACQKAGAEFIAVNSNRDYEKEQANIDYLINEGVDCIITLSWYEAGSVSTAEKCAKAGIGSVVFDACGVMFNHDVDFTASVDFDWAGIWEKFMRTGCRQLTPDRTTFL